MANTHIHSSLQQLADDFVQNVLHALTSASLTDLSELAGGSKRGVSSIVAAAAGRRPGPGRPRGSGRGRGRPPAVRAEASPTRGGRRGGRRQRRSSEDVNMLADKVASFVRSSGGNVAVSEIAKGVGLGTSEVTRPVAIALEQGKIIKEGEKRLTRYYVGASEEKRSRSRKKG